MKSIFKTIALLASLSFGIIACDNTPKPTVTAVTVSATSPTIISGSSQNVTATIAGTGAFDNTINWTASEGTFLPATGASVSYTAPLVTVSKVVTITATSKADSTKFATANITVNPAPTITLVTVSATSPTIVSGSSQNVSATITGTGAFDNTIKWTASEGSFQNPTGALNSYTAPVVTVSKLVTITATSQADATKFASTSITVNPPAPTSSITAVTVTAPNTALAAAETITLTSVVTGTGSFGSGVTWSKVSGNGTLSSTPGASVDFTAPSANTASSTVVRATSIQDNTKFGDITLNTSAVVVTAPTVAISSPSVDVFTKGTVNFQVVVTNAPDTVELLRNGVVLVTLTAPYSYAWDTTSEPEAAYSMTARVKKAGTADVVSAAKQVTVDRTAPTLVSRVPANGTTNVFLTDEISATFNEPLLPSSVNTGSAQLKIGTNVVFSTPSLNAVGTKITIVPTILPTLTATIDMVFTGLTDRAGNVAVIPNSNFVAPDWNLLDGILDIAANQSAVRPSIAIDSSGNPIVAWDEFDGTSHNIYVKKLVGNTWTQLGTTFLDANTNRNAYSPSIAIDSSGNPIVAWHEFDGTSSNIYVKKLVGNTWTLVGTTFLDANTNQDASNPSIAIDSSGNPIVAWKESDGTSSNIYVKKLVGNTWTLVGTTFLDANTNRDAYSPSIAIDSNGNPIVVWSESDGTSNNIYVKKLVGNTWTLVGTTFLDVNTNQGAFSPSIAIDSSGNPIVAWHESDGTSDNVYVKKANRIP